MSYKRVMAKARKRDGIPLGTSYTGSGDESGGKDLERNRNRKEEKRKHQKSSDSHRRNGSRDRHRNRARDRVAETIG